MAAQTRLFNGVGLGNLFWTNMGQASGLGSDQTLIILALRVWLWFTGTAALLQYQLAVHQMYCRLEVGDKTLFQWQAWYTPAGGGVFGFDSVTPAMVNGVPSQEATMKLNCGLLAA